MLASALAATLTFWFAMSMLNQINEFSARLALYDPLGLLPRWTFFAPNPGIYDYHLLYRECETLDTPLATIQMVETAKHLVGPWTPVTGVSVAPNRRVFWNPQRRITKTITDVVAGLTILRLHYPELGDRIQHTSHYWLLLHLVQQESRRPGQRQFALIQSHGFPPDRQSAVYFISNFHPIGAVS